MTNTSVPTKNWRVTRSPSTMPAATGRARWRNSTSSRPAATSGGTKAIPSIRWASARLTSTKGENP